MLPYGWVAVGNSQRRVDGMADVVDFGLATAMGVRLAPGGPDMPAEQARAVVRELRDLADQAVGHVREATGLVADPSSAAGGDSVAPDAPTTVVVDRSEWIRSNVAGFAVVLSPLVERLEDKQGSTNPAVAAVGSRATALQLGGVLAWLSGKVLGQFEVFTPPGQPRRLLLVAPNIVTVERQLDVVPRDFRLWVCMHEETHRVQFGAVPWLADYFTGQVHEFLDAADTGAGDAVKRAAAMVFTLIRVLRGDPDASLIESVQTPAQRAVFDRLTGLMSLLEGHADHVMDDVGPRVIPTVATIRERFERRRAEPSAVDGLARRLLGLDAKLRQYSDGAAFVRGVTDQVGRDGFNRVWESPQTLPTRAEITDPAAWVARVHG